MPAPLQIIALTFRLDADAESRLLTEVDRIEGRGEGGRGLRSEGPTRRHG